MTAQIINADVFEGLMQIADHTVSMVVTSPPYYGLRSYNIEPRQWDDGAVCVLGEEPTVQLYLDHIVQVFRELKRVLHPSGTFWLNIGYCYAGGGKHIEPSKYANCEKPVRAKQKRMSGKQLLMIPARMALALQADGWLLRQDIIWAKGVSFCPSFSGSVMPESTRDRCTWSHEHVFQFALNARYFYDIDGCREPLAASTMKQLERPYKGTGTKDYAEAKAQNPSDVKRRILAGKQAHVGNPTYTGFNERYRERGQPDGRNLRNVWIIAKQNFKGSHMATFPEKLIEPIVKLGTSEKGVCPQCYAPWERKTIREPIPVHIQAQFEASRVATVADTGRTDGHTHRKPNYRRKVLGTEWIPLCRCGISETVPGVLLDPFCGSGRAGIVATRLGRSFIGIDASAEYCHMAERAVLSDLRTVPVSSPKGVLFGQAVDEGELETTGAS